MPNGVVIDDCPACGERLRLASDAFRGRCVDCPRCATPLAHDDGTLSRAVEPSASFDWHPLAGGAAAFGLGLAGLMPAAAHSDSVAVAVVAPQPRAPIVVVEWDEPQPVLVPQPAAPAVPPGDSLPIVVPMMGVGDAPRIVQELLPRPDAPVVAERLEAIVPDRPIAVPIAIDRRAETHARLDAPIRRMRQPRAVSLDRFLWELSALSGARIDRTAVASRIEGERVRISADEVTVAELLQKTLDVVGLGYRVRWDGVVVVYEAEQS